MGRKGTNTIAKLVKDLKAYAKMYQEPPYGREIDGTPELLDKAALELSEASDSIAALKKRYIDGMKVHYQGDDESDGIECPMCGYEVACNDDFEDMKPKHCPDCGTKLLY